MRRFLTYRAINCIFSSTRNGNYMLINNRVVESLNYLETYTSNDIPFGVVFSFVSIRAASINKSLNVSPD